MSSANRGEVVTFSYENASERLDKVVLGKVPQTSRSQIKILIESGNVEVDGKVVLKAGTIVDYGSNVTVKIESRSEREIEPYDFPLDIIFETNDFLVINKPAGLVVHPGAGRKQETLIHALASYLKNSPPLPRMGIIHRLDKDTTGVLVVAKNEAALRNLSAQFAERSVEKIYTALVYTSPRTKKFLAVEDTGTISASVGRDPKNRLRMTVLRDGGKSAVSHWEVVERMHYGILTKVKIDTGRTHQIRVHFAHIGFPIIGDQTYGVYPALPSHLLRASEAFGRQALHATTLTLSEPETGKRVKFEAKLPQDFSDLISEFSKI